MANEYDAFSSPLEPEIQADPYASFSSPVEMTSAPVVAEKPLSFLDRGFGLQSSHNVNRVGLGYGVLDKAKTSQVENPLPSIAGHIGAAIENAGQGITFGFSDEVGDTIGAGLATPFTTNGRSLVDTFGDNLRFARAQTTARLKQENDQYPLTSLVANMAGGIATAAALGGTGAGAQTGNFVKAGNIAARTAKTAGLGAASGAIAGAGYADDGRKLEGAGQGAVLGGGLAAAAPLAGAAISRANTRTIIPNSDELRQVASGLYKKAEAVGGTLKPNFTDNFLDSIQGLKPQTEIGKIVGGENGVTKLADRLQGIRGKPISLDAAQEIDEILGDEIDNYVENGHLKKVGKKLYDLQSNFRNMIENAGPDMIDGGKEGFDALKEGRGLWATSRRLADVEKIIQRAEMTDNPATSIKTGFRNLSLNENRLRGFSPEEVKAIKDASKSGIITDTLRTFGSRLVPILTTASGGGFGATAAATAASTASRGMASAAQVGRASKAAQKVAERSGLIRTEARVPFLPIEKQLQNEFSTRKNALRVTVRPSDRK